MKKTAFFTALLLALAFTLPALAADVKVGVLDLMKVIDLSDAGRKAKSEMEAKIKAAENEVKKKQDELIAMKSEIEKQAPMLSATALAEKKRKYEDKLLDFQR